MRRSDTQRMAKLHRLQSHGSRGLVSMRNTYIAAERVAHAPGDDPLARKELNRRAIHVVRRATNGAALWVARRGVIAR